MKLMTELVTNVMFGNIVSPAGTEGDVEHDALAAHALLQAMEELQPNILCDAIQRRADELMREWTN